MHVLLPIDVSAPVSGSSVDTPEVREPVATNVGTVGGLLRARALVVST